MKDKKIKIGQILMESLTAEQIACMLEVVASAGYLKSLMDDFIKADPDMAGTIDSIDWSKNEGARWASPFLSKDWR